MNEILSKIEMKKFHNMIQNRVKNQNNLLQADVKRIYPMSKINNANSSNLYQMAYGERETPNSPAKRKAEHQDFLASIIQARDLKKLGGVKSGMSIRENTGHPLSLED